MIVHIHFHSHPTGVTKSVENIMPVLNRYTKAAVFGYGIKAPKISLFNLLRLIWSGKETVIHAHRNNEMIFALHLRRFGGRFKLVFTRHSETRPSGFTCYLMRKADHVVSLSAAMSEILPVKSTIIPHGINTDIFRIKGRIALQGVPQEKLACVAGRIRYTKGQLVVMKALAPVLKDNPTWGLMMIGKIDEKKYAEEILSTATQYGVERQVHFIPETDEIVKFFHASNIVIIASLSEGFSLVCLEAMSCGLITIATDKVGIHPDVIDNGRNGFLFPVNDHESLRSIFTDIVSGKVQLEPERIRQRIVDKWSVERNVRELLKLYGFTPEVYTSSPPDSYRNRVR
jgi:mannosyltransferase